MSNVTVKAVHSIKAGRELTRPGQHVEVDATHAEALVRSGSAILVPAPAPAPASKAAKAAATQS